MNMNKSLTALALLLLVLATRANVFGAPSPEMENRVQTALADLKNTEVESLRDPANADLLAELTARSKDESSLARVLLIKLDDEAVIKHSVERLGTRQGRRISMGHLTLAANPRVIPLLAVPLNREESAEMVRRGYDSYEWPVSVTAAVVIKSIILRSPVFTPSVKEWAKPLSEFSPDMRSSMRAWWEANKAALIREDYQAVAPGPQ